MISGLKQKFIIIFAALVCILTPAFSSPDFEKQTDSLNQIYNFLSKAKGYIRSNKNDSALHFCNQALKLTQKLAEPPDSVLAGIYNIIGVGHQQQGDYNTANEYFNMAFKHVSGYESGQDSLLAAVLTDLGHAAFIQKNYNQAESLHTQVYEIKKNSLPENHPDIAKAMQNLALIYRYQNKFTEAEEFFKRALVILENSGESNELIIAKNLNNQASLYRVQGRFADAEDALMRTLNIRLSILGSEHVEVATTMINLANNYSDLGSYDKAYRIYKNSLKILGKELGQHNRYYIINLIGLINVMVELGKYYEAEPIAKQCIELAQEVYNTEHAHYALSMSHLASIYLKLGRYSEASSLFKKALSINRKVHGDNSNEASRNLQGLVNIKLILEQYDQAEELQKQILSIHEGIFGHNSYQVGEDLNSLAIIYEHQDRFQEAESLLDRSIEIQKVNYGENHISVVIGLINLASVYSIQNKYANSNEICRQALSISENLLGADNQYSANCYFILALNSYKQGHLRKTELFCRNAMAIREKMLGTQHPDLTECELFLTDIYNKLGQIDKSLKYFKRFLRSRHDFLNQVFSYSSQEQKLRWIHSFPLIDHALLSLLDNSNKDRYLETTLEMVLNGKAAVLDAILYENKMAVCSDIIELEEELQKRDKICSIIANIAMSITLQEMEKNNQGYLRGLYASLDSLDAEISHKCSGWRDHLSGKANTCKNVTQALGNDEILWEFVKYDPANSHLEILKENKPSQYSVFILNSAGEIKMLNLGESDIIDGLIMKARTLIYKSEAIFYSPRIAEAESELKEITRELYNRLFKPLITSNTGNKSIYIAPDGLLNFLPFEILTDVDDNYVLENYTISYLSSGRDILKFKESPELEGFAFLLAHPDYNKSSAPNQSSESYAQSESQKTSARSFQTNSRTIPCLNHLYSPLRYGRIELDYIKQTLTDKTDLEIKEYYSDKASEESLKQLTSSPAVLHLSTHGFFCGKENEDIDGSFNNPLLKSGIILSGANSFIESDSNIDSYYMDGILTAFEVPGINLHNTILATLSACETGIGDVTTGEGVFGLRRAFLHAGAHALLMSLWNVPDKETCEMMNNFYQYWLGGETKRKALRKASLEILNYSREKYGHGHPIIWGGFVLTGNPY